MRSRHLHADILVGHLTAAETQRDLYLVALVDERLHGAQLHLVIVLVDVRTNLDLFNLDDALFLLRLVLLLLLLIFELAEVENLADRRVGVRADFEQVKADGIGAQQRVRVRSSLPASRHPGRSSGPGGRVSPHSRVDRRGSATLAWGLGLWNSPMEVAQRRTRAIRPGVASSVVGVLVARNQAETSSLQAVIPRLAAGPREYRVSRATCAVLVRSAAVSWRHRISRRRESLSVTRSGIERKGAQARAYPPAAGDPEVSPRPVGPCESFVQQADGPPQSIASLAGNQLALAALRLRGA